MAAALLATSLVLASCAVPTPRQEAQAAAPAAPPPPPAPPKPAGRIIYAGFAMHAGSKAFRNDVLLAESLVKRLDDNALLIKLANPARDQPGDWPQVTADNFTLVMTKMAEVVRPDDRVLLLFSTHSNPGLLNINASGKNLPPITPRMLAAALAPLGNVPTVVVLSACYSGSFIDSLKAPNRVILTATESRRTSFKCQYGGNHTPFAEALFGQADADDLSFTAWAAAAQKTVAAQEKSRKLPPSRPQVFVGEDAKAWAGQPMAQWLAAP